MNLADLTSLAEVGIGVNLTFSLFQDLRERLCSSFNQRVQSRVEALIFKARDATTPRASQDKIKAQVSAIGQTHERWSKAITNTALFASVGAALGLVGFLWCAARHGSAQVGDDWASYFTLSAAGPVAISAAAQCLSYLSSQYRLRKKGERLDELLDLIAPPDPTNVDDSEVGERRGSPAESGESRPAVSRERLPYEAHGAAKARPNTAEERASPGDFRNAVGSPAVSSATEAARHPSSMPAASATLAKDRGSTLRAGASGQPHTEVAADGSAAEALPNPSSIPTMSGPVLKEGAPEPSKEDQG